MTTHHSGAHRPEGPTGALAAIIAAAITLAANAVYAVIRMIAPGFSARARYERRHQRLAGPRPGARLG